MIVMFVTVSPDRTTAQREVTPAATKCVCLSVCQVRGRARTYEYLIRHHIVSAKTGYTCFNSAALLPPFILSKGVIFKLSAVFRGLCQTNGDKSRLRFSR